VNVAQGFKFLWSWDVVDCPTCHGTGKMWLNVFPKGRIGGKEWELCSDCMDLSKLDNKIASKISQNIFG
jgi:hypothetical protein